MTEFDELDPTVRRFIEDAGNTTQSFGLGRVVGQVYVYLYFSREPRNLGDMQEALAISKGSASTAVRQLVQWHAVRKVWVKGDRKDYYEASDWFGQIVKSVLLDIVGKKMSLYTNLLQEIEGDVSRIANGDSEGKFIKDRIKHLRKFHDRAEQVLKNPLVQKILK